MTWITGGPTKHRCAETLHEEWRFKNTPSGIWRCDCGRAWRVFLGTCQWRVRRHDADALA